MRRIVLILRTNGFTLFVKEDEKMYFKDLTKKEKKHLREMGMDSLGEFKVVAEKQKSSREKYPKYSEPCGDCRDIAQKLGLPV